MSFFACKDPDCENTIPEISFESFQVFDNSTAQLNLSFYDCDGDVGLTDADTLAPYNIESDYYFNLKLTYLEKQNGVWIRFDSLTPPFHYRIPLLNENGSGPTLEGTISVKLEPIYYVPVGNFDTIKFEAQLIDRALNKSNIVQTNEILKL